MSLPRRPEVQAPVRVRPVGEEFAHNFVPGTGCGRNSWVPSLPELPQFIATLNPSDTFSPSFLFPEKLSIRYFLFQRPTSVAGVNWLARDKTRILQVSDGIR
jgi:hypothetical protein